MRAGDHASERIRVLRNEAIHRPGVPQWLLLWLEEPKLLLLVAIKQSEDATFTPINLLTQQQHVLNSSATTLREIAQGNAQVAHSDR